MRSATAQASSAVSRVITWRRMPKPSSRPSRSAASRTVSSFAATASGGSPQVRKTSARRAATSTAAAELPPR